MASNRIGRINEEIQRELSGLLRTVKDPRVADAMLTITHVDTTSDLRYSRFYISAMDRTHEKDLMRGLKSAGGSVAADLDGILRQCPRNLEPERFCICVLALCELGLLHKLRPDSVFGARIVSGCAKVNLEDSTIIKSLKARFK